jgi:hypothetical protein
MVAIAKSRQQGRLRHVIARFLFALPNGFGGLYTFLTARIITSP